MSNVLELKGRVSRLKACIAELQRARELMTRRSRKIPPDDPSLPAQLVLNAREIESLNRSLRLANVQLEQAQKIAPSHRN